MANTAIQKIGKRAKQIYNASGKKKKYTACVKEASREYNAGKMGSVGSTRKKTKKRTHTPTVKRVHHKRKSVKRVSGISPARAKAVLKAHAEQQLGAAFVRHEKATTVKATKQARKSIIKYRNELKKY